MRHRGFEREVRMFFLRFWEVHATSVALLSVSFYIPNQIPDLLKRYPRVFGILLGRHFWLLFNLLLRFNLSNKWILEGCQLAVLRFASVYTLATKERSIIGSLITWLAPNFRKKRCNCWQSLLSCTIEDRQSTAAIQLVVSLKCDLKKGAYWNCSKNNNQSQ